MSEAQTLLLDLMASATILLGLPVGKLPAPRLGLRQFLNAVAIGILLFLIWGVLVHAYEPVDAALGRFHGRAAGIGPALGYGALFLLGISAGLLSLVYYERWLTALGRPRLFGPGAIAAGELTWARAGLAGWSAVRRLCLLIAVGIGLHIFGEGLAIGASAAPEPSGWPRSWSSVLPCTTPPRDSASWPPWPPAATGHRGASSCSWALIGGGPTFVGTAVGRQFTSASISVIFLTLAGGSILYVVIQLLDVAQERLHGAAVLGCPAGPGSGIRHRHGRHSRRRLTRTQAPEQMLGDDLDRAGGRRTGRRRRPPSKR